MVVHETPFSSVDQSPDPAQAIDSQKPNHASSEEVEIIDEGTYDQVIDEAKAGNDAHNLVGADPHIAHYDGPNNKDTEDKGEGYSIYIRNLPLDLMVSQLEAIFRKFGAIKPNGVQQNGFCFGFVEFQEFSSMLSAIEASPITIGDWQAAAEIKRTTTGVGSERCRFSSSHGGYCKNSFRRRGNHAGGRSPIDVVVSGVVGTMTVGGIVVGATKGVGTEVKVVRGKWGMAVI